MKDIYQRSVLRHGRSASDREWGRRSGPRGPPWRAAACDTRRRTETDPGTTWTANGHYTVTWTGVLGERGGWWRAGHTSGTTQQTECKGKRRGMLTRLHASISTSMEACAAATSRASSAMRRPRGVASSFTTTHASSGSAGLVSSSGEATSGGGSISGIWEGVSGSGGGGTSALSSLGAVVSLTLLWFSGKLMLHSLSKRNWLCFHGKQ